MAPETRFRKALMEQTPKDPNQAFYIHDDEVEHIRQTVLAAPSEASTEVDQNQPPNRNQRSHLRRTRRLELEQQERAREIELQATTARLQQLEQELQQQREDLHRFMERSRLEKEQEKRVRQEREERARREREERARQEREEEERSRQGREFTIFSGNFFINNFYNR